MTGPSVSPFKVIKGLLDLESSIGDFIANGPSTGIQGWARDKYRQRCNQFANLPGWARALGLGSAASLGRVCQPYYDNQGKDGPAVVPPFTGGQCTFGYTIPLQSRQVDGSFGTVTNLTLNGPIVSITSTLVATFTMRYRATNAAGGFDQRDVNFLSFGAEPRTRFLSPTPSSGGPDTCGDPPGDLQPGTNPPTDPGPLPGPEPSDDPSNPSGPPLLPVPPYQDPIGGPTPIEAPPDATGGSSSDEGQPGSNDNVGAGIPVDQGDGDSPQTDFGTPPAGKVWVGCLLNFDFPSELGDIPNSGPENAVIARVVGNASLVFSGGRGNAETVRSAWQYLIRPTIALEVTGVFLNVIPGITYTVYPVSVESCPPNQCEA